jgi:hypothetical protein
MAFKDVSTMRAAIIKDKGAVADGEMVDLTASTFFTFRPRG